METAESTNQPREILFDLVQIEDVISKTGSYGVIQKGKMYEGERGKNPTTVAFKNLKDSDSGDLEFIKEITAMSALNHTNILKLLGVTRGKDGTRFMIFEYMVKGSLDSWLVEAGSTFGEVDGNMAINELSLLDIGLQITEGMVYMASMQYVHRDLAARNVLLADDLRVKIADFGLARDIEKQGYFEMEESDVYPLLWTAPESIKTKIFNSQSDVWSFGVLLWEIFSHGKLPYEGIDFRTIKDNIEHGIHLEKPDACPQEVYSLMKKCWDLNPVHRPPFETISRCIYRITDSMLYTPDLLPWIARQRNPEANKPAKGEWDISKTPAESRKKWGLKKWPIQFLTFMERTQQ